MILKCMDENVLCFILIFPTSYAFNVTTENITGRSNIPSLALPSVP